MHEEGKADEDKSFVPRQSFGEDIPQEIKDASKEVVDQVKEMLQDRMKSVNEENEGSGAGQDGGGEVVQESNGIPEGNESDHSSEEDDDAYWAKVVEESRQEKEGYVAPPESDDGQLPPPQPAPRITVEERTVNTIYWQKQTSLVEEVKEEREETVEHVEEKHEVIEDIVEKKDEDPIERDRDDHFAAPFVVRDIKADDVVVTITDQNSVVVNERLLSNEEVLHKMVAEGEVDEEDMPNIQTLLKIAKSTRKPKTETFVIRAKKKQESFRKAVDFNSMNIVIEDKDKKGGVGADSSNKRFQVSQSSSPRDTFQVRKTSVIQPASETVVTKKWIENAVRSQEQTAEQVEIVEMSFEAKKQLQGSSRYYEARIKARVGGGDTKSYRWTIRESPRAAIDYNPGDKDTFIVSDLGAKIAAFVAGKKPRKPLVPPFQAVIYSDKQYAIFDDMSDYSSGGDAGLDLDHMKASLRALARLHAMSYAYFNAGGADVKGFSEAMKLVVERHYQPSASVDDKAEARQQLTTGFNNLLSVVRDLSGGDQLADSAQKKLGDRLYPVFQDANVCSSTFSVLCHGFPIPQKLLFRYDAGKRPIDVKLTGFQRARYAHAVTDLQLLFCLGVAAPGVEEQTEFLLRFVYYETLATAMRALGVPQASIVDYNDLKKDFKKKHLFGCLAAGMYFASKASPVGATTNPSSSAARRSGGRVIESKLVGKIEPVEKPKEREKPAATGPAQRAMALLTRAVAFRQE